MKAPLLTDKEISEYLPRVPGWSRTVKNEIETTIEFSGFTKALLFVNAVGLLAESANHHPDIDIRWNRVTLKLMTHDSGGLTSKDFDLAQKINGLPG